MKYMKLWQVALGPFKGILLWIKHKTRADKKPDTTRLMSYEDFSLQNDSYIFNSIDDHSEHSVSLFQDFPYWETCSRMTDLESRGSAIQHCIGRAYRLEKRTNMSRFHRFFNTSEKHISSRAAGEDSPSTTEEDVEEDLRSECFSVSTEQNAQVTALQPVLIHIITSNDGSMLPSTDTVVCHDVETIENSDHSTINTLDEKSRISLKQFIEESRNDSSTSSVYGPMMNLGKISVNDADSVVGALLGVSFDDDYPQLVIQQSFDGSKRKCADESTISSNGTVGVSYPHPASSKSVSSVETTKKIVSCTPKWLDDSIDKVWKQIDQVDDVRDDSEDDDEQIKNDNFSEDLSMTKPGCSADSDWMEDLVLSFSVDGAVKSVASVIEKEVIHPILKPICHFVDVTEIPESTRDKQMAMDNARAYRHSKQVSRQSSRAEK
jgi:hypothetical protein